MCHQKSCITSAYTAMSEKDKDFLTQLACKPHNIIYCTWCNPKLSRAANNGSRKRLADSPTPSRTAPSRSKTPTQNPSSKNDSEHFSACINSTWEAADLLRCLTFPPELSKLTIRKIEEIYRLFGPPPPNTPDITPL